MNIFRIYYCNMRIELMIIVENILLRKCFLRQNECLGKITTIHKLNSKLLPVEDCGENVLIGS